MLAKFVPPGVVTRTLAVPALPAGVEQVAEVAVATLNVVQATPPTVIPVAPVRLVPVMVMDVPPRVEPLIGEMEVTVGWLVITETLELRLFATYALVPSGLKATPIGFEPTVIVLITTFVDVLITETLLLPVLVT